MAQAAGVERQVTGRFAARLGVLAASSAAAVTATSAASDDGSRRP